MIKSHINRAGRLKLADVRPVTDNEFAGISPSVRWLGMLVFLLLGAPKLRIMIGPAPLYAIDALIAYLLISSTRMPAINWSLVKNPLPRLVIFYLLFIWVGEFHGLLIYGRFLESVYMVGEFTLGVSLFFTVPRLVRDSAATALVLKAIVAGLLCCSAVTILYSLPPTRSLVMNTIFSYDFLVPNSESIARKMLYFGGLTEAMRGQSLVGTSTITTGFLGTMWAFSFLAARWPGTEKKWISLANAASVITPVAMLATYGRAAWLTVVVLGGMSLVFGFAKSRRNLIVVVTGLAIIVYHFGWQSELFMVDRVFKKTQLAIENPYEEESFAYRLLSYTQPFSHLVQNPLWIVAGAGRVGQKLSNRGNAEKELRDQAGLSKHSGFGMAYYCYGLLAAIIHVLIMLNGLQLILKRVKEKPQQDRILYQVAWQTFLMAWTGLLFWWLPGHAMIGEARGVILFFFFYGFMMACERMFADQAEKVEL